MEGTKKEVEKSVRGRRIVYGVISHTYTLKRKGP